MHRPARDGRAKRLNQVIERIHVSDPRTLIQNFRHPHHRGKKEDHLNQVGHDRWNIAKARTQNPQGYADPDTVQEQHGEADRDQQEFPGRPMAESDHQYHNDRQAVQQDDKVPPRDPAHVDGQWNAYLLDEIGRADECRTSFVGHRSQVLPHHQADG